MDEILVLTRRFQQREAAKRGKADTDRKTYEKPGKNPISPMWFALLGFVVFGGLLFELVRMILKY
ncbi:hypothetical protein TWF730_008711 [Orbilia blumenaviensis]|uniref:Stress-associated endoplasmic reticulum protein n=1 Tax=Orbilia blumenaviensis TaxID=1796055 RepID=A0AAV9V9P9_9PEZI